MLTSHDFTRLKHDVVDASGENPCAASLIRCHYSSFLPSEPHTDYPDLKCEDSCKPCGRNRQETTSISSSGGAPKPAHTRFLAMREAYQKHSRRVASDIYIPQHSLFFPLEKLYRVSSPSLRSCVLFRPPSFRHTISLLLLLAKTNYL